jgi:hypothetical protein
MGRRSPASAAAWRPLLQGELADRAWKAVSVLGQALAGDGSRSETPEASGRAVSGLTDPTLATGDAGVALFLAHLARELEDERLAEAARRRCERMLDGAARAPLRPGLFSGLPGVIWSLEQADAGVGAGAVDRTLIRILRRKHPQLYDLPSGRPLPYDLSGGLAGIGLYALSRLPRPAARRCLALVSERLRQASEEHPPGRAWRTPPELVPGAEGGTGCFSLGMAHGIPAVLVLLAAVADTEADPGGTRRLLAEGMTWLLAQELPPEAGCRFPVLVGSGAAAGAALQVSPLAWCQGDLGLAAALLAIARRLGSPRWRREAARIALAAAGREADPAHRGELGLCHGAAGVAHLFNRLHQATGEPRLAAAARGWFARLLADLGERRIAGTPAWRAENRKHPKLRWQRGWLNGDAGIGLALLAAVSPREPSWDQALLVSLPEPDGAGAEAGPC